MDEQTGKPTGMEYRVSWIWNDLRATHIGGRAEWVTVEATSTPVFESVDQLVTWSNTMARAMEGFRITNVESRPTVAWTEDRKTLLRVATHQKPETDA